MLHRLIYWITREGELNTQFEWGPLARGVYTALLCLTVLVSWLYPEYLFHYMGLLVFLGVFLRPLIERSGLYDAYSRFAFALSERRWRKVNERRRHEVYLAERDKKYRARRTRDPKLPKNW